MEGTLPSPCCHHVLRFFAERVVLFFSPFGFQIGRVAPNLYRRVLDDYVTNDPRPSFPLESQVALPRPTPESICEASTFPITLNTVHFQKESLCLTLGRNNRTSYRFNPPSFRIRFLFPSVSKQARDMQPSLGPKSPS